MINTIIICITAIIVVYIICNTLKKLEITVKGEEPPGQYISEADLNGDNE